MSNVQEEAALGTLVDQCQADVSGHVRIGQTRSFGDVGSMSGLKADTAGDFMSTRYSDGAVLAPWGRLVAPGGFA